MSTCGLFTISIITQICWRLILLTIIEPVITESSTAALKRKHEADNENEKNHGIVI